MTAAADSAGGVDDALPAFLRGGEPLLDATPLRDLSRRTFFHALAASASSSSRASPSASHEAAATPAAAADITPKTVVLDPALAGPLGLTIDVAALKAHGVDKMFWLELDTDTAQHDDDDALDGNAPGPSSAGAGREADAHGMRTRWPPRRLRVPVNAPTRSVVYICRPELACMRVVAGHILADLAANSQTPIRPGGPLPPSSSLSHTYSLLLSPRRTELSLLYLSSLRLLPGPQPRTEGSASALPGSSAYSSSSTQPSASSYLTTVLDLPLEFLPLDGTPANGPTQPAPTKAPGAAAAAAAAPAPSPSNAPAITASSLLSLEWTHDFAFTRLYRDGDHASIYLAAQALMTVQHVYGLIPRILGKGDLAKRLADLLIRQRREHLSADPTNPALVAPPTFMPIAPPAPGTAFAGASAAAAAAAGRTSAPADGKAAAAAAAAGWSNPNRIDALIIIDRSVDWASVLCTQLTYEGLIKEMIGIRNAHVDVDASLVGGNNQGPAGTPSTSASPRSPAPTAGERATRPAAGGAKRKYLLSAHTDPLYPLLRDLNFSAVGERLHAMATRLNALYAERSNAQTMAEIKAFVGRLGGLQARHQALGVHTDLTERITARTSADEGFHRMLEVQQNIVAGLDLSGQLAAIEDLIYASTSGPGGLLAGTGTAAASASASQDHSVGAARSSAASAGFAAGVHAGSGSLLPILRLLCLMSVVSGGIKAKNLEYIKRELCQTFGYEVLPLLLQLAKVGLLTREGASSASLSSGGALADRDGSAGGGGTGAGAGLGSGSLGTAGLPTTLSATGATSYSGFSAVRRPLKLINDDVDERSPRDVSYVFSGYAPLSVRLVQIVAQREALLCEAGANGAAGQGAEYGQSGRTRVRPRAHPIAGWKGYEDVLSVLPGATFDEAQRPVLNSRPATLSGTAAAATAAAPSSKPQPSQTRPARSGTATATAAAPAASATSLPLQPQHIDPDGPRTTLVFFLGGATYAEVSALRFMSAQTRNRRFVALTTHMLGGDDVIGGLVDGFGR